MTSLIGTIGGGLTWSGSLLVSYIISKGCNLSLMCLAGSAIMSLGLVLSSLSTKVRSAGIAAPTSFHVVSLSAVAPLHITSHPRRDRVIDVVLPCHITDSGVFRSSPRIGDGDRYGRFRRRWTGPGSRYADIVYAVWCSRHAAHSRSVELCCLYSDLVRDASPPGVSSSAANFGARYEGDVHRAGTEIPSIYRHASA